MFVVYCFSETEMATHIYDTLVAYDRYTAECPELKHCMQLNWIVSFKSWGFCCALCSL